MCENRLGIMALIILAQKMEMKMCECYTVDGRKITGMTSHSYSFCYVEDTWLKYLARDL